MLITVSSYQFEISAPYEAEQRLGFFEARELNVLRAERIRKKALKRIAGEAGRALGDSELNELAQYITKLDREHTFETRQSANTSAKRDMNASRPDFESLRLPEDLYWPPESTLGRELLLLVLHRLDAEATARSLVLEGEALAKAIEHLRNSESMRNEARLRLDAKLKEQEDLITELFGLPEPEAEAEAAPP